MSKYIHKCRAYNNGQSSDIFPANFDQPMVMSVVAPYRICSENKLVKQDKDW